jgi:hypothetical protein
LNKKDHVAADTLIKDWLDLAVTEMLDGDLSAGMAELLGNFLGEVLGTRTGKNLG